MSRIPTVGWSDLFDSILSRFYWTGTEKKRNEKKRIARESREEKRNWCTSSPRWSGRSDGQRHTTVFYAKSLRKTSLSRPD